MPVDGQTPGIDFLHAVEKDLQIFDPQIEGFSVWPIVRFPAWKLISAVETGVTTGSLWRRLRYRPRDLTVPLYALWSILQWRRHRRRRFEAVFITSESYRSVKRADGWWHVCLDDISAHPALRDRILWCEIRHFMISPLRTPGPRHLFTDRQVLSQMWRNRRKPDPTAEDAGRRAAEMFDDAMTRLDRPLSSSQRESFRRTCIEQANAFLHALPYYDRLLDQFAPRVLVMTTPYVHHAPVAAALRRGIPVVEFQHGVIHADHPGYIWSSSALGVRNRLAIPTVIATYGDHWSGILASGGFWQRHELVSVGSARMDWLRDQAVPERIKHAATRIIFTTQYATRKESIPLLRAFLELARGAGIDFRLTIKVHRSEAAFLDEYRQVARGAPQVSVLSAYEDDTLALIRDSDVHVSGWSTCHYESLGLGTPTVVCRFSGPDRTADLAGIPGVSYATNARELLDIVHSLVTHVTPSVYDGADHLFRRNAVENAVALLRTFIGADGPSRRSERPE